MFKAIDVSHWQTPNIIRIMYENLGIKGVMIRAGNALKIDEKMESFVSEAEELNLHYGFYWYYTGKSSAAWKKQTELFLQTVSKYNPDLPLAIDYEEEICQSVNQCCIEAGTMIENASYFCVVYSNRNFMNNQWNQDVKDRFGIWLASWVTEGQTPDDMWKYWTTWKCNIVMLQYATEAFGYSVDCNEIVDNLPRLCNRVRRNYYYSKEEALEILNTMLDKVMPDSDVQFYIVRSGDLYHIS